MSDHDRLIPHHASILTDSLTRCGEAQEKDAGLGWVSILYRWCERAEARTSRR